MLFRSCTLDVDLEIGKLRFLPWPRLPTRSKRRCWIFSSRNARRHFSTGYFCADANCSRLEAGESQTFSVNYQVSPTVVTVAPYVATAGVSNTAILRGAGFLGFGVVNADNVREARAGNFGDSAGGWEPTAEHFLTAFREIHAGFRCPRFSHEVLLDERISHDLNLKKHGVEAIPLPALACAPSPDGAPIVLHDDIAASANNLRSFNSKDAVSSLRWVRLVHRAKPRRLGGSLSIR